jgi:DNA-binding transcriptional LysR family regulator
MGQFDLWHVLFSFFWHPVQVRTSQHNGDEWLRHCCSLWSLHLQSERPLCSITNLLDNISYELFRVLKDRCSFSSLQLMHLAHSQHDVKYDLMTFQNKLLGGINVLSAVVEAGSFVRAGETLGLTQPAVSRAVARLEEQVGIRIFHRTARSIALTEEGRRFFEAVAPHLARIEEAATTARGSKATVRGRLRVNADELISEFLIAPNIQPFLSQYPELSLEVSAQDRMGDLVAGGFDMAVRFGLPQNSSLICQSLLETRVITCASPSYLASHPKIRHPSHLENGHQGIMYRNPSTGAPFEWEFKKGRQAVPVRVTGQLHVNHTSASIQACLAGQGVAQLLEFYMKEYLADGRLIRILPEWGMRHTLCTPITTHRTS